MSNILGAFHTIWTVRNLQYSVNHSEPWERIRKEDETEKEISVFDYKNRGGGGQRKTQKSILCINHCTCNLPNCELLVDCGYREMN